MSVQIVEDLISTDSIQRILELLEPKVVQTPRDYVSSALGWPSPSEASRVGIDKDVYLDTAERDVSEAFSKAMQAVEEHFGVEMSLVNGFFNVMVAGAEHSLHCDNVNLDGSPLEEGVEEPNKWSAILYLNDEGDEFEGGNLCFPLQNMTLYPKAGRFVFFETDVTHSHEVTKVLSGIRKCLVFFYGDRNDGADKTPWNTHNGAV